MRLLILLPFLLLGCATPRSNTIFGLKFSEQPPRAAMRAVCNGKNISTQGVVVCEQKTTSKALVSVKVMPLQGRVVYSNGQIKKSEDFNWYPKEGFWIWKKKPIKDTWLDLDLEEVNTIFGDWPVALDIIAIHDKVGVINTRGLIYYRVCNDKDIPCSNLTVQYDCAGVTKSTGPGEIGKCDRLSGSSQAFSVQLKGTGYEVKSGAKLYITAPRSQHAEAIDISNGDLVNGYRKFEIPEVENGPTLVGVRVVWYEAQERKAVETRILLSGSDPGWTGLDTPHWMLSSDRRKLDVVQPSLADIMEVNMYEGQRMVAKEFGADRIQDFATPKVGQTVCAFAWQRDSSDLSLTCLNSKLEEVRLP